MFWDTSPFSAAQISKLTMATALAKLDYVMLRQACLSLLPICLSATLLAFDAGPCRIVSGTTLFFEVTLQIA